MTMKRYIKLLMLIAVLFTATMIITSCQKEDEVPQKEEKTNMYKTYKLPSPEKLSADEKTAVDAIKDEYNKSTNP